MAVKVTNLRHATQRKLAPAIVPPSAVSRSIVFSFWQCGQRIGVLVAIDSPAFAV
jgi:hypothetical protein